MSRTIVATPAARATLDTVERRACPITITRAAVRYALTDVHAAGADAGLGLVIAAHESPGTFADVTDADIDAMLAGVAQ